MNAKEELTKLLMESYDKGVKDAKQEALIALEKVVAVRVAAEREAWQKQLTSAQRNELKQIEDGTWEADRNG